MAVDEDLARVIRDEGARLLATLIRTVGDFSIAEEAVQEAAIAALRTWSERGLPDEPRAWLTTAARRKAIDIIRRERVRVGKERAGAELMDRQRDDPFEPPDSEISDDLLRLIFTCCHPSLAPEGQLALALRTLCQLSVAQVASVLLTSEAAVAKRLTRTRQKIAAARIPYRVPGDHELPERLAVVCGVVHALYTAGHHPDSGTRLVDVDACAEGVRLARLLCQLMPDEPMPAAVLALALLTEARRPARTDADGAVVLLSDQDRSRWDHDLVSEGAGLLNASLQRSEGVADPYQLQAAIAWEHDRAPSYAATDWAEIVRLFDLLVSVAPTWSAALSRAVAVAELDGPAAGLAAVDSLGSPTRAAAVRAELLARLGRYAEAADAGEVSLSGELSAPERDFRERQRAAWLAQAAHGSHGG